jgi:hypothetical protein
MNSTSVRLLFNVLKLTYIIIIILDHVDEIVQDELLVLTDEEESGFATSLGHGILQGVQLPVPCHLGEEMAAV